MIPMGNVTALKKLIFAGAKPVCDKILSPKEAEQKYKNWVEN